MLGDRRLGFSLAVLTLATLGCGSADPVGSTGTPLQPEVLPGRPTEIQLIGISDWHGQLDPITVNGASVGGAANLSSIFKAERANNPNTLTLTAGDAVGASPPLSGFFDDEPAIKAMNLMGFDADTFGNHNFDKGPARLQKHIDLAQFSYVSSNLGNLEANLSNVKNPYGLFTVGPVTVGVVGITNPDAPSLLFPGSLGTLEVQEPVAAANAAIKEAKSHGAAVVVVLVHMGATAKDAAGNPTGPLLDFAAGLEHADVVLGDHTDIEVNTTIGKTHVLENRSKGATYARVTLNVAGHAVLDSKAELIPAKTAGVTPDPAVTAMLAPYRSSLAKVFDGKTYTEATAVFQRSSNIERLKEVPIGNLISDALRTHYGTQIAFVNGGGIRAPFPSTYLPADKTLRRTTLGYAAGPPYDLVTGDVYTVLPFGNAVLTRSVSGKQLWAALEHSVSSLPAANGKFLQISGFRFVCDLKLPAGARVVSVQLADGTPIAKDDATYTAATVDFMNSGGDGYTMLADGQGITRDLMADVVLAQISGTADATKTLTPYTDGRITILP